MYIKAFKFIYLYIRKSKKYIWQGIAGMLIASLAVSPIPYIIGDILDYIINETPSCQIVFNIIILLLILYMINYISILFYQREFVYLQQNLINNLKYELIKKIINSSIETINKYEKGYLISRINEVHQISGLLSTNVLNCMTGIIEFLFCLIIMLKMSKELTFVILLILPFYYLLSKFLVRKTNEDTIKMYESSSQLNGSLYETFQGLEDIKILNAKKFQLEKISKRMENVIKKTIVFNMNLIKYLYSIIFTGNTISVLILAFSIFLILKGKISIGIYTSFTIYMSKLLSVTHSLASLDITIKPIVATIERLKELLAFEDELFPNSKNLEEHIESVSFVNVDFKYKENEKFVIKGFNKSIKRGDNVLLSGINGSGKTTLIKLIVGLYKPTKGKILINNIEYSGLNNDSIRKKISIVSQNIFLFNCSVWENILYGSANKNKNDVIRIINQYNLSEYISQFENGIDTNIENNEGLSGGQKQIVALLRALIRDTDILIFDEATTNLDISTKYLINDILNRIETNKIQFIISHDTEGLKNINVQIDMGKYKECNIVSDK